MGGVDFSKAPRRNISRTEFTVEHPRLDTTTRTSVKAETSYRNTEVSYLGGDGSGRTGSGGGGKATPSPTPSGSGTPTGGPSAHPTGTPTPQPSTGDSGGPSPAPAPPTDNAGGGGLADTGTRIALWSAPAAVLLATGITLMWWMRRRRAALR